VRFEVSDVKTTERMEDGTRPYERRQGNCSTNLFVLRVSDSLLRGLDKGKKKKRVGSLKGANNAYGGCVLTPIGTNTQQIKEEGAKIPDLSKKKERGKKKG